MLIQRPLFLARVSINHVDLSLGNFVLDEAEMLPVLVLDSCHWLRGRSLSRFVRDNVPLCPPSIYTLMESAHRFMTFDR